MEANATESRLSDQHAQEVARGARFEFGANWTRFLSVLDDDRIAEAETSLREMLGAEAVAGSSWLDIGSGSGLFSLAAMRLGADRVHSFDFDPSSVGCAQELRRRYFPGSEHWTIEQGSALDSDYIGALGYFDIVYSWGVLHHTGDLWQAVGNATQAVAPGGLLFISIYNDEGLRSRLWRIVKAVYNRLPASLRTPYAALVMLPREVLAAVVWTVALKPQRYWRQWTEYKRSRGMSRWHDLVDWVGGYPYEVATPDEVFDRLSQRGFTLVRLITRQGLGCNEFVFRREHAPPSGADRG